VAADMPGERMVGNRLFHFVRRAVGVRAGLT
jgi:hypothetical protein